jgi:hypothetical protein
MDPRWLRLDLRLLSSSQRGAGGASPSLFHWPPTEADAPSLPQASGSQGLEITAPPPLREAYPRSGLRSRISALDRRSAGIYTSSMGAMGDPSHSLIVVPSEAYTTVPSVKDEWATGG